MFYYGPYELKNNETKPVTIANTANTGSLTIDKTDAETNSALAGVTFTVSVDTAGWSDETDRPATQRLPKGRRRRLRDDHLRHGREWQGDGSRPAAV